MRRDEPALKQARRGCVSQALSALHDRGIDALIHDLELDRDANSSHGDRFEHFKTWARFHNEVFGDEGSEGYEPILPLTPSKLVTVAALFKAGTYRSFPNYASSLKTFHVEEGFPWLSILEHTTNWCTKSTQRGIGPARQSHALRLHNLLTLTDMETPLVVGGPCWAVRTTLIAIIFLLREIELALARLSAWSFDHVLLEITWLLPTSKSDPSRRGTSRTWGCLCSVSGLPCPYHLAVAHAT